MNPGLEVGNTDRLDAMCGLGPPAAESGGGLRPDKNLHLCPPSVLFKHVTLSPLFSLSEFLKGGLCGLLHQVAIGQREASVLIPFLSAHPLSTLVKILESPFSL